MKNLFLAAVLGVGVVLGGCATTMPLNYVASPQIKGSGSVGTGEFKYTPADQGLVKRNAFQKGAGAIGTIHMSEDADALLKASINKELIAAGFDSNADSDIKISGDIKQFKYDWRGFVEVDFYLDVEYTVDSKGSQVYKNTIKTHKAAPKIAGGTDSEAVRSAISANIGELLQDLRAKKII